MAQISASIDSALCLAIYVNQNNVRPYLPDVLIGNDDIRLTIQKAQHFAAARHHNFADAAAALIEFQITDLSQLFAVSYVNHILAFKLRKKHFLRRPFVFFMYMQKHLRKY